eukprot:TRINITY_DN47635_c0_g1_i1.p1 TRINITY_DN47635_c0_g1~~TRINITY_DN47635_c0_g1_i1.p1  ORF type:complete len:501 (-),score=158.52 TRINITY_DN47635_c0_g1_i1:131-1633(-)
MRVVDMAGGDENSTVTELLNSIWRSSLPLSEKRRLCRFRVVTGAPPVKEAATTENQFLEQTEEALDMIGKATGSPMSIGAAVGWLREVGNTSLAKRLQALSRTRNAVAHPKGAIFLRDLGSFLSPADSSSGSDAGSEPQSGNALEVQTCSTPSTAGQMEPEEKVETAGGSTADTSDIFEDTECDVQQQLRRQQLQLDSLQEHLAAMQQQMQKLLETVCEAAAAKAEEVAFALAAAASSEAAVKAEAITSIAAKEATPLSKEAADNISLAEAQAGQDAVCEAVHDATQAAAGVRRAMPEEPRTLNVEAAVRQSQRWRTASSDEEEASAEAAAEAADGPLELPLDAKLTLQGLLHYYVKLEEKKKTKTLFDWLDAQEVNKVVIFVRSAKRALALSALLNEEEECCKRSRKRIVVSIDPLGYIMDMEGYDCVIHYDFPLEADMYLHRVSHFICSETKGCSVSFIANAAEEDVLKQVQCRLKLSMVSLPSSDEAAMHAEWNSHG